MSTLMIGVVGIILFIVLIFLGMNIGLALLLVGFLGYAAVVNPVAAFALLRTDPATQASTYTMMVVPLFILMGNFAFQAGMSKGLYDCANKWLNRLPGSLACATVAACAGFGAICGSCAATCATMGTISIPEMRRYGYADRLATGSVAMGGTLGVLIPPSTPMVFIAIMAVNLAIHREFSWKALWEKTKEGMWTTIRTFSMTFLIIIGADIFCKFLTITNIPMTLANYIGGLHVSRYVILALMTLVYLFLGMIMDELPMIMLTVPIFWPIAKTLGFDVIWFGVYVILTMELGAISPPVGLNCFIISGIAKDVPLSTIYKGALPFMLTIFVGIALLAAFPQIALVLPGLMN